jgi:hypothetical protein
MQSDCTCSSINLTFKNYFLAMLHPLLDMHLHCLLFSSYYISSALVATWQSSLSLINELKRYISERKYRRRKKKKEAKELCLQNTCCISWTMPNSICCPSTSILVPLHNWHNLVRTLQVGQSGEPRAADLEYIFSYKCKNFLLSKQYYFGLLF